LIFYLNKSNEIDGGIYNLITKERIYIINGNIDSIVSITDANTGIKEKLYDAKTLKIPKINVKKVSEQQNNESRKVWYKVTKAMLKSEIDVASFEKK